MRGFVPPDPETSVSSVRYAVVQVPNRRRRRFPAGLVQLMESAEAAQAYAATDSRVYAAEVLGPSKSSEGQFLYYLVRWLGDGLSVEE